MKAELKHNPPQRKTTTVKPKIQRVYSPKVRCSPSISRSSPLVDIRVIGVVGVAGGMSGADVIRCEK